jgi:hypothetical protein
VPICNTFLVTEAERKLVKRGARFQHWDESWHQVSFFFFLQGKVPNEIHAILTEILRKYAPPHAVKNWVAQFKRGDTATCYVPCPGRPQTATTPEIFDQIYKPILEDRRPDFG